MMCNKGPQHKHVPYCKYVFLCKNKQNPEESLMTYVCKQNCGWTIAFFQKRIYRVNLSGFAWCNIIYILVCMLALRTYVFKWRFVLWKTNIKAVFSSCKSNKLHVQIVVTSLIIAFWVIRLTYKFPKLVIQIEVSISKLFSSQRPASSADEDFRILKIDFSQCLRVWMCCHNQ